jgi:hypothetical protein
MPRTHALRKIIGEIGIEVPAAPSSPCDLSELAGHEDILLGVKEAGKFEDQKDSASLQPASDQQVVSVFLLLHSLSALTVTCVMVQTPPARRIVLL